MKPYHLILTAIVILNSCTAGKNTDNPANFTSYVDPYIGTGYHGHVFIGANVPFGAVQVGPTNYVKGWDWCSGYHYSDSIVTGFSQLHLSGTGIGELGDVLITPFTGELKTTPGTQEDPFAGYASKYTHQEETAKAGYYSVMMKRYDIKVELTATERVAFHKYTYPKAENAHIAVNLISGIGWDKVTAAFLKKIDSQTFAGYRFSTGWAKDQRVFFAIKLSKPVSSFQLFNDEKLVPVDSVKAEKLVAVLNFSTGKGETVLLKVGISPVSEKNALENIEMEAPDWDFEKIALNADRLWNKELGKVSIKDSNENNKRTFYTSLFHSYTQPVLFNDHNGEFPGANKKVYSNSGYDNYSVFSLWDTYRAEQPLLTILQPERINDLVNTMLNIYLQQGKLPIWHLMGNETDCMVGYSAVPVIVDAYFKGFNGFDVNLAFEAVKASSTRDDYGMNFIKEKGFIPADREKESVSKALEYCISDWCIAQMARKLNKAEDYTYYITRAGLYAKYFDTKRQFVRAVLENGKFREPFSPFQSIHEWGDYTEGNAWQYTWLVPHDVEGLIKLFGGDRPFITKLDSLFFVKGDMGKQASSDISGLIGQYAHGNEPSHHIIYLYAYAGEQWKTAEKSRLILSTLYSDKPDGLSGNEDCGQMSAWYVFSSMGFYPLNPANGAFVFGSPLFNEVTINLPGQKQFNIKALNNNAKNIYIQSVRLNGSPYNHSFITYKDIMKGGKLEFEMGPEPNKQFGTLPENRPSSKIY
jgi:predicted alpha-1,2-mannosidase